MAIVDKAYLSIMDMDSRQSAIFSVNSVKQECWLFFHEHESDVIVEISVLKVFHKTVKLGDLKPLFIRLFGQDPADVKH